MRAKVSYLNFHLTTLFCGNNMSLENRFREISFGKFFFFSVRKGGREGKGEGLVKTIDAKTTAICIEIDTADFLLTNNATSSFSSLPQTTTRSNGLKRTPPV